jgi:hypothetical protein
MVREELPEEARALLLRHIESAAFLDVLLLVQGGGDRSWTPAEIGRSLDLDEVTISRALVGLRQGGLLKVAITDDLHYRYAPAPDTARAVEALAEYYRDHPGEVMELLAARPPRSLRQFAAAFRLRKDE